MDDDDNSSVVFGVLLKADDTEESGQGVYHVIMSIPPSLPLRKDIHVLARSISLPIWVLLSHYCLHRVLTENYPHHHHPPCYHHHHHPPRHRR